MTCLERSRHDPLPYESFTFAPFKGRTENDTGPEVVLSHYGSNGKWEVMIQLDYCSGVYSDYGCGGVNADDPLIAECLVCLDEFRRLRDEWNAAAATSTVA